MNSTFHGPVSNGALMKPSFSLPSRGIATALAFLLAVGSLGAAEMRTWRSVDGKTLEGTFEKVDGENVVIKTSDGRPVSVPKTRLSQGDLQYIKDIGGNVPDSKPAGFGNDGPAKNVKVPIPAKEVKIDKKTFVKKDNLFYVAGLVFNTVQSEHFYVNYLGNIGADPADVSESAERLWHEMAFLHPSFADKWGDKRMALFFTEKDKEFNQLGKWYRDMLFQANPDNENVRKMVAELEAVWPQTSGGTIMMDAATADQFKTHASAPTLHLKDPKMNKGVWSPFRTHFLSEALLEFQAGGTQGFGSNGRFALFTGFAYFKEIQLCGESQTALISAKYEEGSETKTAQGFANSKDWAGELRKVLRSGTYVIKAPKKGGKDTKIPVEDLVSLKRIFSLDRAKSQAADLALIYGLVEFMHSTPERLAGFSKLIDTIDKARQIPDVVDVVKIFGYQTPEEFQTAWLEWMKSGQFK